MRWAPRTATTTDLARSGWASVLALAALLGVGGCAGSADEWPDTPPNTEPIRVAFTATVRVADGQAHVSYRVVNNEGSDLVVLNRVHTTRDGRWQTRPELVYVVGRDGGRVEISKRALPQPPETKINLYRSPTVGGTVLPAGGALTEEFAVPLPLTRSHPYGNDVGYGEVELPDPIVELVFCLGIVREPVAAGLRSPAPSPVQDSATAEVMDEIPHAGAVLTGQHLFCSDPVRAP
jgi:hypothetical protein